jgi:hypothetical protein
VVTQLPTTPVYAANAFNPNPVYSNPTYNNVPQGFSYGVVNYPAPSYQQNPVTGFYPASAGTGNWGMAPGPFSYGSRAAS